MIRLQTPNGTLYAEVFIVDNDREIAVVLRRDSTHGQIIAFETFAPVSRSSLESDCLTWLSRREIRSGEESALISELDTVFEIYDGIRSNGHDIVNGWAGSRRSRRLPDHYELAN